MYVWQFMCICLLMCLQGVKQYICCTLNLHFYLDLNPLKSDNTLNAIGLIFSIWEVMFPLIILTYKFHQL